MEIKGIDVSKWQGMIDWPKVAADGVKFVMVRLGFGSADGTGCTLDPYYERNVEGALAAGIEVGCYFYSYAQSVEAAKKEAAFTVGQLAKYSGKILYPIAFDIEDPSQASLGKATLTAMTDAFCAAIEAAGYYAMFYASANWAKNYLDMAALARYDFWLAQWASAPTYTGRSFNLWQSSSKGQVSGISGNVDLDTAYMDFAAVIRQNNLNGYTGGGKKSVDEIANEVIAGNWGNGADRRNRLTAAGYDYDAVQAAVNAKLGITPSAPAKSNEEIAREVIAGNWGNGAERRQRLTAAGYNYDEIQRIVNQLL